MRDNGVSVMPDNIDQGAQGRFDFTAMKSIPKNDGTAPAPYHEQPNHREDLLARVRTGELPPEEAEAIARKLKIAPLERRPPASIDRFDATMCLWTPQMLLAWIADKTPRSVHRHYATSFKDVFVWTPNAFVYSIVDRQSYLTVSRTVPDAVRQKFSWMQKGHELTRLVETVYGTGFYDFDGAYREFLPLEQVFPLLKTHLVTGAIKALGMTPVPYSAHEAIKPGEWANAEFKISDELSGVLEIEGKLKYRHILFERAGILASYRSTAPELEPRDGYAWKPELPVGFAEWKKAIVAILQRYYPYGLPKRTEKDRDDDFRKKLPTDCKVRWYGKSEKPEAQADEAFRIAMRRLENEVLDKTEIISLTPLPRLNVR